MLEFLQAVLQPLVLVFLVSGMMALGMGMSVADILQPLRDGKGVGIALVTNFLAAPLIAFGITRLFQLDPPYAAGLMLLGLAAGAPFLPRLSSAANGEPGLAVGLTVLLMTGSTIMLPIALPMLVQGMKVNAFGIAGFLISLMLLPLAAGLAIRARAPASALRLRPLAERVSGIAMALALLIILILYYDAIRNMIGTRAILAALCFALLTGLVGGLSAGNSNQRRVVFGLGAGIRNVPAALMIAVQNFHDPRTAIMILVGTQAGILVLLPIARWLGRRAGT